MAAPHFVMIPRAARGFPFHSRTFHATVDQPALGSRVAPSARSPPAALRMCLALAAAGHRVPAPSSRQCTTARSLRATTAKQWTCAHDDLLVLAPYVYLVANHDMNVHRPAHPPTHKGMEPLPRSNRQRQRSFAGPPSFRTSGGSAHVPTAASMPKSAQSHSPCVSKWGAVVS
jgi:hypothetical protein